MRVLLLGASRNIGYYVAQRLLAHGHDCTLLLRKPDAMESDPAMSGYIRDGKAKLVQGDGLVKEDVQRAWDAAKGDSKVDLVFFGIGECSRLSIQYIITHTNTMLQAAIPSSRSPKDSSSHPQTLRLEACPSSSPSSNPPPPLPLVPNS